MKLVVDLLGADNSAEELFEGCKLALDKYSDLNLVVFSHGNDINIEDIDKKRVTFVDCNDEINADDNILTVTRRKESSMIMAMDYVSNNIDVDGIVSAGPTGAFVTSSIFILKRKDEVSRPSLMIDLPSINNKTTTLLDLGANIELNVNQFTELAIEATNYVSKTRNIEFPKISLLNIGEEKKKGTKILQNVNQEFENNLKINFEGNIESRYLLNNESDIIICDGYSGNLALKAIEGMGVSIFSLIKDSKKESLRNKLGLLLLKPVFKSMYKNLDYNNYGGAVLLGVKKIAIKAHGSSDRKTFSSAINQFVEIKKSNYINKG